MNKKKEIEKRLQQKEPTEIELYLLTKIRELFKRMKKMKDEEKNSFDLAFFDIMLELIIAKEILPLIIYTNSKLLAEVKKMEELGQYINDALDNANQFIYILSPLSETTTIEIIDKIYFCLSFGNCEDNLEESIKMLNKPKERTKRRRE